MASGVRNVLILLALAALVAIVPGGGTASNVVLQALSLAFIAAFGWVGMILYREHRVTLYSLGDRRRAILYVSAGIVVLTLSASPKLWHTGGGKLAWFALLALALYGAGAVLWSARRL